MLKALLVFTACLLPAVAFAQHDKMNFSESMHPVVKRANSNQYEIPAASPDPAKVTVIDTRRIIEKPMSEQIGFKEKAR